MKNYNREIGLGLALVVLFAGLLTWFLISKPQAPLIIAIGILIVLVGVVTFSQRIIKKKRDFATGAPSEDEFTRQAKVYAGNQAFEYSMYLWMLIFVFNSSFNKSETMLGVGILGSALIYGICVWYFQRTSEFNEE